MDFALINANMPIGDLETLLLKDGLIQPVPAKEMKNFNQTQIMLFCLKHGIYQIPTTELLDFFKQEIGSSKAIEIGAGNGCIGRNIGVRMTDSKLQNTAEIKAMYAMMGQPTVKYGKDVETIDANKAVKLLKPETVIASWVTHKLEPGMKNGNMFGIKEEWMFRDGIKKYVHAGNFKVHFDKPILNMGFKVKIIYPDWLYSRGQSPKENCIFIIEK